MSDTVTKFQALYDRVALSSLYDRQLSPTFPS
jgi:hypothetical protein